MGVESLEADPAEVSKTTTQWRYDSNHHNDSIIICHDRYYPKEEDSAYCRWYVCKGISTFFKERFWGGLYGCIQLLELGADWATYLCTSLILMFTVL